MNKAIYIHRKRSTSVTRTVNLADVYPLKSIEEPSDYFESDWGTSRVVG